MKNYIIIFLFFSIVVSVQDVHAGGAVARRQQGQKAAMQQKRMQQIQMQQMMMKKQMQQQVAQEAAGQIPIQAEMIQEIQRPAADEVKQIVTLDQVMQALATSSRAWSLMIDKEAKEAVVLQYIQRYRKAGIGINKSPDHYANMIDSMAQESPEMLDQSFDSILQVVAIIEYDFNNGKNKDDMALQVLGNRQAVEENRSRLGL